MNFSPSDAFKVLSTKLENWLIELTAALPNLFLALFIIVLFYFLAKIVRKTISEVLQRFTDNAPVARLMSVILHFLVVVTGIFIALGVLNLDKTVTSLLAGAGVIGLALGFAFQEIASNFIAGILIAFRRPFKVNDIVKVNDYEGRITDIDLRTTRISTYDGLEVIVPNKDMFTNTVINFTASPERRVDLEVGVSYGEDLRKTRDLVLKVLENVNGRIPEKSPEVFFSSFADSSIIFKARVWITHSDPISYLTSQNDMVILIKEAFDQNNIVIPFPIRTLDFGIKGGEKLSEVMRAVKMTE